MRKKRNIFFVWWNIISAFLFILKVSLMNENKREMWIIIEISQSHCSTLLNAYFLWLTWWMSYCNGTAFLRSLKYSESFTNIFCILFMQFCNSDIQEICFCFMYDILIVGTIILNKIPVYIKSFSFQNLARKWKETFLQTEILNCIVKEIKKIIKNQKYMHTQKP